MSKRLIVCCDGTWNDPEDHTNIEWLKTNVVEDHEQRVYYDPGVGTHWYDANSGGALGVGLSRNVRQAYRFIRKHYEPGDEIYCFGFSRGSYTARSLCGFMQLVGQLKSEDDVDEAYLFYRLNEPDDDPNVFERLFERDSTGPLSVRFLGVFDTVGALGVPLEIGDDASSLDGGSTLERIRRRLVGWVDHIGDRVRRPIEGFHDARLGTITEHACHALAIDEARAMFVPTLWTAAPGHANRVTSAGQVEQVAQNVEQVWFAGVHSDVGGGYPEQPRLADIPLLWMVDQAAEVGLRFDPAAVAALRGRTDALAPQHDSMTRTWQKLHDKLHQQPVIRPMSNPRRNEVNPAGDLHPRVHTMEAVHASVGERVGQEVQVVGEAKTVPGTYDPSNLPDDMPVQR